MAKVKFHRSDSKSYDYFIPSHACDSTVAYLLEKGWNKTEELSAIVESYGRQKVVTVLAVAWDADVDHRATRELVEISNISNHFMKSNRLVTEDTKESINKKGVLNMKENLFGKFGEKVEGIFALSMFDNQPAYKLSDTWVTLKKGRLVDVGEFVMEIDVPGIVMPSVLDQISTGDLIMNSGDYAIVTNVKENRVEIIDGGGNIKTISPITSQMMNMSYVLKVFNPMANNLGVGNNSASTQSQGGIMGNLNPMMLMAMKDKEDSSDMFKNMMMMQMMQGGNGMFGNTNGTSTQARSTRDFL